MAERHDTDVLFKAPEPGTRLVCAGAHIRDMEQTASAAE
jgi:hypothetical protein